jgi:hypothetical protein
MLKRSAPSLVLLVALAVLAGCGGGGSKSGGGGGGGGSTSGVDGVSVGNCLNSNYEFIVQPGETELNGTSPGGVGFALKFYKDAAAAKAAAAKSNPKFTAVVLNAVIDFHGNPSPYAGAPPVKISKTELDEIRLCIQDPNRTS